MQPTANLGPNINYDTAESIFINYSDQNISRLDFERPTYVEEKKFSTNEGQLFKSEIGDYSLA